MSCHIHKNENPSPKRKRITFAIQLRGANQRKVRRRKYHEKDAIAASAASALLGCRSTRTPPLKPCYNKQGYCADECSVKQQIKNSRQTAIGIYRTQVVAAITGHTSQTSR
jgi:hypothetical protein